MKKRILGLGLACLSLCTFASCKGGEKDSETQVSDTASLIAKEASNIFGEEEGKYPELDQEIDYNTDPKKDYLITIKTKYGEMKVILYDETIGHKKNFVKLATLGFLDSTAFHRVMQEFMIQGGDPNSKGDNEASYGAGGPGYTIPAEFNREFIHKKGALAAARTGGPQNPNKESSGSQFYIVQGKKVSDQEFAQMEQARKMPINQAVGIVLQKPENEKDLKKAIQFQQQGNQKQLDSILDIYKPEAEKLIAASAVSYTKEQKEIYKTIGGTPFLDMDYTVYGEVVKGLDVLDKIAAVRVGGSQNSLPMSKIVMDVDIELLKKKEITRKTGYEYKK
jgi:peptidyl-prolyl cis-trans isomerase B (cyclophilin B)